MKFFRTLIICATPGLLVATNIVKAQSAEYPITFLEELYDTIDIAIPVLIALALALFLWGLVVFIAQSGNEQARTTGKQRMIWGVIALFVLVNVWGIVNLLQEMIGVEDDPGLTAPDVHTL